MADRTADAIAVTVIPARYASQRLPGKPLIDLGGQTMIERVYRRAIMAKSTTRTIVATDDERIRKVIEPIGEVAMTAAGHESGSDRIAEVARDLDCDIVINVQGDLPLLDPQMIDSLVEALRQNANVGIATIAVPIRNTDELDDPAIVKVVCDRRGQALYFSRTPIPYDRDAPGAVDGALSHVGLYAYRRDVLLRFSELEPSPLERKEKLEQLRALENGIGIAVVICDGAPPHAIDTPNDLAAVRQILEESNGSQEES
jgi:3-deoxy-manno-octulosonate cytidylyltransferase (CMP-KDO synthetase)